jgi:hypothetical protein
MRLVLRARDVVFSITRARVPMPKTTQSFIEACQAYGRPPRTASSSAAVSELLVAPPKQTTPLEVTAELQAR